jgi:hypothetical protein
MRVLMLLAFVVFTGVAVGAPIPKTLKKKRNYDFDGYWEVVGENINGKPSPISNGKYWMIDKDKFYYNLKTTEINGNSNSGTIKTPDEDKPWFKIYSTTTPCRLEIEGEDLTWVFANEPKDPLENCDPGPQRVIYYFKRAK